MIPEIFINSLYIETMLFKKKKKQCYFKYKLGYAKYTIQVNFSSSFLIVKCGWQKN